MRTTLTLWLVTVALGVGIFLTWYAPGGAVAAPPVATEEPLSRPEVTPAVTEEVEAIETMEVEPIETEQADDSGSDNSGPGSDNRGMGSSATDGGDEVEPVETEEAD